MCCCYLNCPMSSKLIVKMAHKLLLLFACLSAAFHEHKAEVATPEQIAIAATGEWFRQLSTSLTWLNIATDQFMMIVYCTWYVNITIGIAETPIVVTWVTFTPTNSSVVHYWLHGADPSTNTTAIGSSKTFVDHGSEKVVRYIHRVKIAATDPHQEYGILKLQFTDTRPTWAIPSLTGHGVPSGGGNATCYACVPLHKWMWYTNYWELHVAYESRKSMSWNGLRNLAIARYNPSTVQPSKRAKLFIFQIFCFFSL